MTTELRSVLRLWFRALALHLHHPLSLQEACALLVRSPEHQVLVGTVLGGGQLSTTQPLAEGVPGAHVGYTPDEDAHLGEGGRG